MKKLITIYIIVGLFVMSSSCSDILDQSPDGYVTYEEIFASNDKTGAYLNSCYAHIQMHGLKYFFWSRGPVVWSDDAWDADELDVGDAASARLYDGRASAANHPILNSPRAGTDGDYWNEYWAGIRKCAIFLHYIDNANVASPIDKSRWKAEAHVLRAYYYQELLRWFGTGLPIARDPFEWNQNFSEVERESYKGVVEFIIEDCNAAIASNDLPWRITIESEYDRATKALAEAIKSRMILYAASTLYNDGENHWTEAYEITKQSLNNLKANGYDLYNKVHFPQTYSVPDAHLSNERAAVYNEYFTQTMKYSSNPIDKETIYQSRHGAGNIWDVDGVGAQDGYKSGTCPSQELVDAYETIDGQPILDLANPYLDEKHLSPNYNTKNTLYDPNNPYKNRDPRFYASIYYNGSKRTAWWTFEEPKEAYENYPAGIGYRVRSVMTYLGEPKTGIHNTRRSGTRTGYYERKFLHPNSGNGNVIVAGANYKFFRLGEMILNFAESAVEAGKIQESVAAINEIRTRAGMPLLSTSISQEELRLRVRNERRIELGMEEHRYFDVRRWSKPDGDLSKTDKWITALEITRVSEGVFSYKRRVVRDRERMCYSNKYLKVPIPLDEVNVMQGLTGENWQNPGW